MGDRLPPRWESKCSRQGEGVALPASGKVPPSKADTLAYLLLGTPLIEQLSSSQGQQHISSPDHPPEARMYPLRNEERELGRGK